MAEAHTKKLSPCFVSRFPVWVKIAIDAVLFCFFLSPPETMNFMAFLEIF